MKKPALLSLIRIPPLCAIQRCTSGTGPLATDCRRARSRLSGECDGRSRTGRAPKKGGRRSARPIAIESSSQQVGLVHHAHGVPNLGQGLLGDLVGATVALVQHVLHVVQIVLVALTTLTDRGEVLVDGLGHVLLELA